MSKIDQAIATVQAAMERLADVEAAIKSAALEASTSYEGAASLGAARVAQALSECKEALGEAATRCGVVAEALDAAVRAAHTASGQSAALPGGPGVPHAARAKLPDPPFFKDLGSLRGATKKEVVDQIPAGYVRKPLKKGKGVRYLDPTRPGVGVYIEDGWPGAPDPVHAGPYVKIVTGRGPAVRIPLAGSPALTPDGRGRHGVGGGKEAES